MGFQNASFLTLQSSVKCTIFQGDFRICQPLRFRESLVCVAPMLGDCCVIVCFILFLMCTASEATHERLLDHLQSNQPVRTLRPHFLTPSIRDFT